MVTRRRFVGLGLAAGICCGARGGFVGGGMHAVRFGVVSDTHVTGAASGMGLMASQEFARLGARVVMCDRAEAQLRHEVEKLKSENVERCEACVGDVRRFAYAEEAAKIAASLGAVPQQEEPAVLPT